MVLHSLFEGLAWVLAIAIGWWARRHYFSALALPMPSRRYPIYLLTLWLGAAAGAYGLGDLNLALAGIPGSGRSILGGIVVAEFFKAASGVWGSTGAVFVLPLSIAIAVGRLGCFSAGLDDYTYGTPTTLPRGVDFRFRRLVDVYPMSYQCLFLATCGFWLRWSNDLPVRFGPSAPPAAVASVRGELVGVLQVYGCTKRQERSVATDEPFLCMGSC